MSLIKDVKKIKDFTYLINNSVKLSISEDLNCTAEFDDSILSEDDVNKLIDEFFIKASTETTHI